MTVVHLGFPSPSIASLPMPQWPRLATLADDGGFDCLWHSNERFFREMFVRMAATAMSTERIGIGGAIAEPYAVHPILTAQSLATVDELSGGRATLAMGAGGSGFPMMGVARRKPAVALREALQVIKGLLAGETVTLHGEIVRAYNARLHFGNRKPVPLWIASRGDRVLEVAGELADGVMIATLAKPAGVSEALGIVERGASSTGRTLGDMRIMSRVDTCVHDSREQAYAGCRLMVARLLWLSFPDRRFVERSGLTVPDELEAVIEKRDYDLMEQVEEMVPDEFVDSLCWAGTPNMVADRVIAVHDATGISEFGLWLLRAPDQTLEESMRLVKEEVLPRVRARIG
jgi:5,10-methylenetetrahydromethanopterin reductase